MYTRKKFPLKTLLMWTRWETLIFIFLALIPTFLYKVAGFSWLQLPWTPIALIGTAVAFIIGFQNNAAYERAWEARKIWGGIVNASRTWTIMVRDMVTNEHAEKPVRAAELADEQRMLVYRHLAWLTALRHAMRQRKPWEVFTERRTNRQWHQMIYIPERETDVAIDLQPLISEQECQYVLPKTNQAAALLSLQSKHLRTLKERGLIWEFSFLQLENVLAELLSLQGKSERIKNFPYPRQYATLGYDIVRIFVVLLPFGVIPEFARIGESLSDSFPTIGSCFVWLAIPFTVIVSWVFNTMQRIGTVGENPFEGSANDVPISTIARGIEIDLRELLDEDRDTIPEQYPALYNVQM